MNTNDRVISSAIASLLALGLMAAVSTQAAAADGATEKCAGIKKAGKNDCGTTKLSCHGLACPSRKPIACDWTKR